MLNLEKSLEERGLGVKGSKIPGDAMIPHGPQPTRASAFGARLGICTCNCFCCFFMANTAVSSRRGPRERRKSSLHGFRRYLKYPFRPLLRHDYYKIERGSF